MILSVTAAAKAAGVSRTTLYEKIRSGELSRSPDGIDTAELLRVFGALKSDKPEIRHQVEQGGEDMTLWLRDKLDDTERELRKARAILSDTTTDLQNTRERLHVHQEAARMLEDKSAESARVLETMEREAEALKDEANEAGEKLLLESRERAKVQKYAEDLIHRGWVNRLFNRIP